MKKLLRGLFLSFLFSYLLNYLLIFRLSFTGYFLNIFDFLYSFFFLFFLISSFCFHLFIKVKNSDLIFLSLFFREYLFIRVIANY